MIELVALVIKFGKFWMKIHVHEKLKFTKYLRQILLKPHLFENQLFQKISSPHGRFSGLP